MADQPSGAQANAPVTDEGIALAQEYDKARDERVAAANETDEIGEGRTFVGNGGAVQTGTGQLGQTSQYVGKGDLSDLDYVLQAKGLDEAPGAVGDGPREADGDPSWTAQSARAFVDPAGQDIPGQTFTLDELPDPAVVSDSILPAHAIPAALVVDAQVTDSLNASQERGGDLGTSPKAEGNERPVANANRDDDPEKRGQAADKVVRPADKVKSKP